MRWAWPILVATVCAGCVGPGGPGGFFIQVVGEVPAELVPPLALTFRIAGELSKGSNPVWDFGDGSSDTGAQVSHDFVHAGAFKVQAEDRGLTATRWVGVTDRLDVRGTAPVSARSSTGRPLSAEVHPFQVGEGSTAATASITFSGLPGQSVVASFIDANGQAVAGRQGESPLEVRMPRPDGGAYELEIWAAPGSAPSGYESTIRVQYRTQVGIY